MRYPQRSAMRGGTNWRRFAALILPAATVAGAIVFGIAEGAIAASFAVSGQTFKVSASKLEGEGFAQYGGTVQEKDGTTRPVAISSIADAKLHDLCQSTKMHGVPVVLTIKAGGGGDPVTAKNLVIDMDSLQGNATFSDMMIGRDAADLSPTATPGSFGQSAEKVVITDLKQVARSTSAGSFTLTGLKLSVNMGDDAKECF